jgi:hypothetical protein
MGQTLCLVNDHEFLRAKIMLRRINSKLFYTALMNSFVNIARQKIENDNLSDEDAHALVYLTYELVHKMNSMRTPPVYWYSRKG